MVLPLFFPATLLLWNCGSGKGEEPSGGNVLRRFQIRLATVEFRKNLVRLSSQFAATPNRRFEFHKAVSLSSARTMKRFPSLRYASARNIVCQLESTAETQPQLQPALLRLSRLRSLDAAGNDTFFYSIQPVSHDRAVWNARALPVAFS